MGKLRKKKKSETNLTASEQQPMHTSNATIEDELTSRNPSTEVSKKKHAQFDPTQQGPSKKRKREHPSSDENKSQSNKDRTIFNGLTLAISTLESKTNTQSDSDEYYTNFKTVSSLLKANGATISPQVHKRVHYLICTEQAVNHLTQRVRQALKRNVDVVNVKWVKLCIENGGRVDVEEYLLNGLATELMNVKTAETKEANKPNSFVGALEDGYESDIPGENAMGWSEPIALDCCCVCHENGDENCPWCTDCNINLAKKKK